MGFYIPSDVWVVFFLCVVVFVFCCRHGMNERTRGFSFRLQIVVFCLAVIVHRTAIVRAEKAKEAEKKTQNN